MNLRDGRDKNLNTLIARLNNTEPLNQNQEKKLYTSFMSNVTTKMLSTGETYGRASGGLPILNQSEEAFRKELRSIDNDIERQISIFQESLDRWFNHGEPHPPYYPWRIIIILSKLGKKEKEKEFLAAYCKHFLNWKGNRDEKIVARARKLGAVG